MPHRLRSRKTALLVAVALAAAILTAPLYASGDGRSASLKQVKVELVDAAEPTPGW